MNASMQTEQQAALDEVYSLEGLAATFVPKTGTGGPCVLLQDQSKSAVEVYIMAGARLALVRVRKSEVPAVKTMQDKFTVGSSSWRIDEIIDGELDLLEWVLQISKE